ncbi:DNA-binding FadR family transcriptional regulator [Pseudorhodobacter sp. 4114]|nr:DNA-binding FadR family transcriptional regulator [Pseudorhodobacter sp. 4114]
MSGDYPPGSILPNEAEWSEMFGTSRSVVREAIKMLMSKNLLVSRTKIGSRVEPRENWNHLDRDVLAWASQSPHRDALMRSVQQLRHIIEPEAAALAAGMRSEAEMTQISAACQDMGTATTLSQRTRADRRFHQAILNATRNELLMPLGAMIDSSLDYLFTLVTREANDLRHAQDLHEAIERAIRLKRPDAARRAVKALLSNTDDILQKKGMMEPPAPNQGV